MTETTDALKAQLAAVERERDDWIRRWSDMEAAALQEHSRAMFAEEKVAAALALADDLERKARQANRRRSPDYVANALGLARQLRTALNDESGGSA